MTNTTGFWDPRRVISPAPHVGDFYNFPRYPRWRYKCPVCEQFWQMDTRLDDFRHLCPPCDATRRRELCAWSEDKHAV
jgi:hypothetical protein